ncbi:cytochrome P450, partial [Phlebopus sp. FC_14]
IPLVWLDVPLVAVTLYVLQQLLKPRPALPFPPGPKGLPLVGNFFDVPTEKPWETFSKWRKEYGDIASIEVFGRRVVILNSSKHAVELLERRSQKSSNRPNFVLAGELIGWKNTLVLSQYGERFKEFRRKVHRTIGTRAVLEQYYPHVERQGHRFLKRLLDTPLEFSDHVRWMAGAIILVISHGYDVRDKDDPYLQTAEDALRYFSLTTSAEPFLVDILPFLRYVPSWFPGASFHRIAKAGHKSLQEMTDKPYETVKAQMTEGIALPSFTAELINSTTLTPEDEHMIKWAGHTFWIRYVVQTVAAGNVFFLLMSLHPKIQAKAQAEIDVVVGSDRLPTIRDRAHLPYVNALVVELLRWFAITPLGITHVTTEDDIFEGYLIPKGSYIFPNMWHMLHDLDVYPDPFRFKPERFAPTEGKVTEPDPHSGIFGFGRRILGVAFAEMAVFTQASMVLAVFDVSKAFQNGKEVEPVQDRTSGTISHPLPFKCAIKPRSAKAVALIQEELDH